MMRTAAVDSLDSVCEIGHWVGDAAYEDKFGNEYFAEMAQKVAGDELAEYEDCLARERAHERYVRSAELDRRAGAPIADDSILEQPTSLDPIAKEDLWISNNRRYWRPWKDDSLWIPQDWVEMPNSSHRVAIVHERMARVAYRRRSDDGLVVWTKPLRQYELSKRERQALAPPSGSVLDPTNVTTCPWNLETGSFSRDRSKWIDPKYNLMNVKLKLKWLGVVTGDFWRIAFRDMSEDGQPFLVLSLPVNWADLTDGERASFEQRPVERSAGKYRT